MYCELFLIVELDDVVLACMFMLLGGLCFFFLFASFDLARLVVKLSFNDD